MGGGRVFRIYPQVVYKESLTVNHVIDRSFSSVWVRHVDNPRNFDFRRRLGDKNIESGSGNPPQNPF